MTTERTNRPDLYFDNQSCCFMLLVLLDLYSQMKIISIVMSSWNRTLIIIISSWNHYHHRLWHSMAVFIIFLKLETRFNTHLDYQNE